ncbi:hypothetical protein BP5796_04198 [Coleophoma crateriformis]|uniref:Uncharacterized protein n=1 Tax=Coleophoma crateriformis TaxID=565419 RepID=A0A3D8SHU8_9HELO|nr:hypothetical protein BP5796_04198 [Coleophoma crateriformis]
MDPSYKLPGSPGTPLFQVSPERVNQQRGRNELQASPTLSLGGGRFREGHSRESSVHEKVAAFNSLNSSGAQAQELLKQAAQLKRAMLGREEAVRAKSESDQQRDHARTELRKYENETRKLSKQVEMLLKKLDESKARELIVCQKLETRQEELGQSKEKYQHTKAEWEKEVRRLRKEAFRSQSSIVKLQEELKASRLAHKIVSSDLESEKQRNKNREQEAFEARYQLVGVQEELAQMIENVKLVEQERDALRTIAKNEEIARIAAEGRLPLPFQPHNDEFASPKKARSSLDPMTILSSAASEEEMEELKFLLDWEKQNATRAHDRIEFLEEELRLQCAAASAARIEMPTMLEAVEVHDAEVQTAEVQTVEFQNAEVQTAEIQNAEVPPTEDVTANEEQQQSHIFIPEEGVFRAISPQPSPRRPANIIIAEPEPEERDLVCHARTPTCEPPARALGRGITSRTSLQSLFDGLPSPQEPSNESMTSENMTSDESAMTANLTENIATTIEPIFHTISTTTRVPLVDTSDETPVPKSKEWDNFCPTMTREEALAQIRERRGRARSLAQGTLTPRKQMVEAGARRDISAPTMRSGNVRGRSAARSA